MPRLGVNVDHVATLREVRHGIEPQPVFAALICEACGADSIVAHLREDRRHIKDEDVPVLKKTSSPKSLCALANASARIISVAYPTWGSALTYGRVVVI